MLGTWGCCLMCNEEKSNDSLLADIGLDIQRVLWSLFECWKNESTEVDHVQVFELSVEFACGEVYQKIVHSQEGKTETFYYKNIYHPVDVTIWIVDSEEGAVMMRTEKK
jgi:hypothetical protein